MDLARSQLLQLSQDCWFDVLVYCLMPDHAHLLVEGTSPNSDLRSLMDRWKQKTGYLHKRATHERLWQGGYYDHVLREEENRLLAVRYILENPVRAGLVCDVRDYQC